jgi:hypothetical protein
VHTADAESVSLHFFGSDVALSFLDWQKQERRAVFVDILAFRWQEFDEMVPRDDVVYEVINSEWLVRQSRAHGVGSDDYRHYKLCFNANGTLDVLCRTVNVFA